MQRRFRASLRSDLQPGSQNLQLFGKLSANPLRYSVDMTGHQTAGAGYFLDREGYRTYLLNYTVRGEGRFTYEGAEFSCGAGDLVFIDCERRHVVRAGQDGWEFWYLHCAGPAMPALYADFTRMTGHVLHDFNAAHFLEGLQGLQTALREHPHLTVPSPANIDEELFIGFSERVYAMLNDIWLQCAQACGAKADVPESVLRAQAFLEANFTRRVTLAEVAAAAYVSPCRIAHLFRRYLGTTVGETLSSLRLRRATELLSTTDEKVCAIAVACGYSDAQMLKRLMRGVYGMTPTQYRAAVRSGRVPY